LSAALNRSNKGCTLQNSHQYKQEIQGHTCALNSLSQYTTYLTTKLKPNVNLKNMGDWQDVNLTTLFPWHQNTGKVNCAIQTIGDIGLEASVHQYQQLLAMEARLNAQQAHLNNKKQKTSNDKMTLEAVLVQARAASCIQNELLKMANHRNQVLK
jgi:hypothetical protein